MSVKAENRYRMHSRRQTDAALDTKAVRERQRAASVEDEIAQLRERLSAAEADLRRARQCVERQRVYLTAAYNQVSELRGEVGRLIADRAKWISAFMRKDRAWRYVSRIVRDLCAPSDVAKWREEQ